MTTPPPPVLTAVGSSAVPGQPGFSLPARIINTFSAPSRNVLGIRRNASCWEPSLLTSILAIAFSAMAGKGIGFDEITHRYIPNSNQFQSQPPGQQAPIASNIAIFIESTSEFAVVALSSFAV